jgi:rhodanese-related sulfurtransferase
MVKRLPFVAILPIVFLTACAGKGVPATPAAHSQSVKVSIPGGSYRDVSAAQLKVMLDDKDFTFINVHVPYEGEIAKTDAFVPYNEIEKNLDKLPADKNAKIVLYCRSGRMSAIAAETLVRLGYTDVWNVEGGMLAWERLGLPLGTQ